MQPLNELTGSGSSGAVRSRHWLSRMGEARVFVKSALRFVVGQFEPEPRWQCWSGVKSSASLTELFMIGIIHPD